MTRLRGRPWALSLQAAILNHLQIILVVLFLCYQQLPQLLVLPFAQLLVLGVTFSPNLEHLPLPDKILSLGGIFTSAGFAGFHSTVLALKRRQLLPFSSSSLLPLFFLFSLFQ